MCPLYFIAYINISNVCSSGAVDESWDGQCVSPWWQQVRTACVQSESAASALLAALVAHRVAKNAITRLAESKVCVYLFSGSVELLLYVCNFLSLFAVSGGVGVCFSGVGAMGGLYKAVGGCSCSADASLSAVSSGLYRGRCYTLLSQNTIREWQRCVKHTYTIISKFVFN